MSTKYKYRFYKFNSTIPPPTNGKHFLTLPTRIIYTPPPSPGGKFKWNSPEDKQCGNFLLLLQKVFI